jgi:alginate O-acetyltransferase complex protein AlgI
MAGLAKSSLPAWGQMWIVAFSLFGMFKWLSWRQRGDRTAEVPRRTALAYFFGWVGLDADEFCSERSTSTRPAQREWWAALGKTLFGAAIIWLFVRRLPEEDPTAIGMAGLVGFGLFLHFGFFHLLALVWRQHGVGVLPIMEAPLRSTSLAEFWGRRWNRAYRQVSFDCVFRPCVERLGATAGVVAAFLISGVIHDLVISFPARGGYGGPTAYFLLHGVGLLAERTAPARRFLRGSRGRGWVYTALFVVGPIGLLFHQPFLTNVVIPFLKGSGAR